MNVALLSHQWDALNSTTKHTALVSGIGSGKTWCGVHWCINKSYTNPKSLGFIGANTFSQLRNSTLAAVFSELDRLGIEFTYNQSSGILVFLGKRWLCKSLENYDVIRGIEIGEYWLDECAYTKQEAFQVILGRLRDKHGSLETFYTTTPKGFNWIYDYFHPSGEKNTEDFRLITASSGDNKFLPVGYIDSLRSEYDDNLIEQELNGAFINISNGRTYYGFDRDKHLGEVNKSPNGGTVYVGLDFNVDPYCGVMAQYYNGKFYIFDEIFERNSDSYIVGKLISSKSRTTKIIPDSTGRNRKTSGKSDFDILRDLGHTIMSTHNPYVIDRVNNINRLFAKDRIIISPKCKKLINDLEKVVWKEGESKLDGTSDKMLTHISDALGYLCWKLDSFNRTNIKITSQMK